MKFIDLFSGSLKKYLFLSFLLFTSFSCKDDPVKPPDNVDFSINIEDVSCIETWLRIKLDVKTEVNLFRNDLLVKTIRMTSEDTLIVDDGLLPNHTYYYRAETEINKIKFTEEISIQTMDTTSHNYTFQTWSFGNANTSGLKDVVIINEDNIWCVGEIYLRDSSEIVPTLYNAIHWDGIDWSLHRIMYYTICGQQSISSYEASGIIAFNDEDIIILAAGYQIAKLKGTTQLETICIPFWVSLGTIWGKSNLDFYLGGYKGALIHFKENNWKKIPTGSDLPIRNLYGALDPKTDKYEILCVGDAYDSPGDSKVFSIKEEGVEEIGSIPFGRGVWFIPNRKYIVVGGDGLWEKRVPDKNWERKYDLPPLAKSSIAGQGYNDIFVGGSFWLLGHWNGYTWDTYFQFTYGGFAQVRMKDNVVVAVGIKDRQAVVIIGKR